MKLALIVDNRKVARWQLAALSSVSPSTPIAVFSCNNTRVRRRVAKHFLYYCLNAVSVRNPLTRKVELSQSDLNLGEFLDFESRYDGAWQRLPNDVAVRLAAERPDAIIKFGMSLLRVPRGLPPILSYHHGDPSHYRGRPAGFWELLEGRKRVGQVVQIISNRLDAGAIVAFAETKVFPHSYRATLMEAYRHSPLLLGRALSNVVEGRRIAKSSLGRNYRLPGNLTVARFIGALVGSFVRRLFYGALVEKHWTVSTVPAAADAILGGAPFPPADEWSHIPRSARHVFHADPFYHDSPAEILVEAMNRAGKGEVVLIRDDGARVLSDPSRHFSYPATIRENGSTYIVPEIAQWSEPQIYRLNHNRLEQVARLDVPAGERIVDPTLFHHGDRLYLFGNKGSVGSNALCLWSAASLFCPFVEHPDSPVLISPRGARMAGHLVRNNGTLYRLGQNGEDSYGDGILLFRIEELSPRGYRESFEREIRFSHVRGPHTLGFQEGQVLFDWYQDRMGGLSWLRRVRARLGR